MDLLDALSLLCINSSHLDMLTTSFILSRSEIWTSVNGF